MITKEQIEEYVKHPFQCPFCGSEDIVAGEYDPGDFGQSWQPIACKSCGKKWTEVYTLTTIEEDE